MKVLVGVPDPAPHGFHFTDPNEIVTLGRFVCRSHGCGCDRSWTGLHTTKGATLAQVIEPPPCFRLKPELWADPIVKFVVDIAARHPVGTLFRATYDWNVEAHPQTAHTDDFLSAWVITAVTNGSN